MLSVKNDVAKCAGQDNTGNNVCSDRERCGRYVRPDGDRQQYSDFWKAGRECQWYESIVAFEEPSKLGDWEDEITK